MWCKGMSCQGVCCLLWNLTSVHVMIGLLILCSCSSPMHGLAAVQGMQEKLWWITKWGCSEWQSVQIMHWPARPGLWSKPLPYTPPPSSMSLHQHQLSLSWCFFRASSNFECRIRNSFMKVNNPSKGNVQSGWLQQQNRKIDSIFI